MSEIGMHKNHLIKFQNARREAASLLLLEACQSAYGQMLKMPPDGLRIESQKTLCLLRDAIAEAIGLSPEHVQEQFERNIAR